MAKIERAAARLKQMDALAALDSPLHALHPLVKLCVTLAYILTVVSYPKYALSGLMVMLLYPVLLFALSGISAGECFSKIKLLLPLVILVGLPNIFFDRTPLVKIGTVAVSGGTVSWLTLTLKGALCLTASFMLAATTRMDALCAALRRLHVPKLFVTLMLLTWRYIGVLLREAGAMTDAYRLRAPGQHGVRFDAWGSFLGRLLLRSADRASDIYAAMCLRGFDGEFRYAEYRRLRPGEALAGALAIAALVALRRYDLVDLLGRWLAGGLG